MSTIKEADDDRRELERSIYNAIQHFEAKHGVSVSGVNLMRAQSFECKRGGVLTAVFVEVVL